MNRNIVVFLKSCAAQVSSGNSNFSYRVIEETGPEQIIEVVESYHDGDNTIWSRYKATQDTVSPISSRMFYFGYMFSAIPYGLAFALILFITGRFLRRKVTTAKQENTVAKPE